MLLEHDSANHALQELRRLTNGFVSQSKPEQELYTELLALETDLHRHIYLENEVLFPRAICLE
jgi:regulator of cell morphogenesis and NO signaling